ncbi:MAG: AAA family ATPase [Nevskiaceae bacterium]|nr:MAG: AAA family ATPase [Nevskiaceae bacterium]
MTTFNTMEQLRALRLHGMAAGLDQQLAQPAFLGASFEQRLQMLVDAESSHRDTQRYRRILRNARLKILAMPEDLDYHSGRGLEKNQIADLLSCAWIARQQNLLVTGPTGTGKTFLGCAMGVQAARKGMTVAYRRVGRLLEEMAVAYEDGSVTKLRNQLAKTQLLILDDFGLTSLNDRGRSDLLELLDDRVGSAATIVLGQLPIKDWHSFINDPAVADAILDRLVHSSVKIVLRGDSMRKLKSGVA